MVQVSIVSPLYRSESYIKEFYRRSVVSADKVFEDIEFIFVNDGSDDLSTQIVKDICDKDSRVTLIDLSRNFGQCKAVMTGLEHAKGDYVWLIDVDLEDQPEWINSFYDKLISNNLDVVYGVQDKRKGLIFEKISGYLFYNLMALLLNVRITKNHTHARIMNRRYCQSLVRFQERNSTLIGLFSLTGYRQDCIKVSKKFTGNSTYTFRKKFALAVDTITSFSSLPLEFSFYLGIFIFIIAVFYTIYLVFNWLFFSSPLLGWTSVMASLWLLGGLLIALVGLVGIYISKIFIETKQRPYTIIKEIYNNRNKIK